MEPGTPQNSIEKKNTIRDLPHGILDLGRQYSSRYGVPVISRVDTNIFRKHYFTYCLQCDFCHDGCCTHGVDFDLLHLDKLKPYRKALEAYTGISSDRWFRKRVTEDEEMPGGGYVRTRVEKGACIFLNRRARGCMIHAFALEQGIDYHEIKPMTDCLFPITFAEGVLYPSSEVDDDSLVCLGTGPTLYQGARNELRYYFGEDLIATLDILAEGGTVDVIDT